MSGKEGVEPSRGREGSKTIFHFIVFNDYWRLLKPKSSLLTRLKEVLILAECCFFYALSNTHLSWK
jgi:hypothetical protein